MFGAGVVVRPEWNYPVILSIPFLACDWRQLDLDLLSQGYGVEASLFERDQLMDDDLRDQVEANLRRLSTMELPSLTFHFPVNDFDYVEDASVRSRLVEVLLLAAELHLDGVVLHSNRIGTVAEWRRRDLPHERHRLRDVLVEIAGRVVDSDMWVGMENMPITGNDGQELDPLLIYPEDLAEVSSAGVSATWDVCHFSYTAFVGARVLDGSLGQPESDYPALRPLREEEATLLPRAVLPYLTHVHFSAFAGVADRRTGACTVEGVLPYESDAGEAIYRRALLEVESSGVAAVTLEIAEEDYRRRSNVRRMLDWCTSTLDAA